MAADFPCKWYFARRVSKKIAAQLAAGMMPMQADGHQPWSAAGARPQAVRARAFLTLFETSGDRHVADEQEVADEPQITDDEAEALFTEHGVPRDSWDWPARSDEGALSALDAMAVDDGPDDREMPVYDWAALLSGEPRDHGARYREACMVLAYAIRAQSLACSAGTDFHGEGPVLTLGDLREWLGRCGRRPPVRASGDPLSAEEWSALMDPAHPKHPPELRIAIQAWRVEFSAAPSARRNASARIETWLKRSYQDLTDTARQRIVRVANWRKVPRR